MEKYLKTPLYHGTDDFIGYMSKEEREDMKKKCFLMIEVLSKVYDENGFKEKYNGINTKEVNDITYYLSAAHAALEKNVFYEYDDIYLTSSIKDAIKFAKNAYHYGEIGTIAWKLYEGLSVVNYELPALSQEQQEALDSIIGFADHDSEPVIYSFINLPIENLVEENGRKKEFEMALDKETGKLQSHLGLRYKGELSFTGENVHKFTLEELENLYPELKKRINEFSENPRTSWSSRGLKSRVSFPSRCFQSLWQG